MLCKVCGTDNPESSRFCKKCGILLEETPTLDEPTEQKNEPASPAKEAAAPETAAQTKEARSSTVLKEKEVSTQAARTRTSPLAVRMNERKGKEEEKIKKKLHSRRRWVFVAVFITLLFLLENAAIIAYHLGALDNLFPKEAAPEVQESVPETIPAPALSEAADKVQFWRYHYELVKHFDPEGTGAYDVITETIISDGRAIWIDEGGDHLSVLVTPGQMMVDGVDQPLGNTPEAFSGWRDGQTLNFQMKGTEQKFFAAGGAEPLVVSFTPDEEGQGRFDVTYDKVVSEMNMRYHLVITFIKD